LRRYQGNLWEKYFRIHPNGIFVIDEISAGVYNAIDTDFLKHIVSAEGTPADTIIEGRRTGAAVRIAGFERKS
jgi:hypothetical protein